MMNKILLNNARLSCHVGISEKERKDPQTIFIDLVLFIRRKKKSRRESIDNTVDYSMVYKRIKESVKRKKYHLIEEIAEDVADRILREFNVEKIRITVKKPHAMEEVEYAAVEITRRKYD